jgi:DNA-binding NtrC family response regulator
MADAREVLLVEDEPLVLETTAELLTDAGFRVVRAASCEEAMAALDSGLSPSAIVADINLGSDEDGLALARCVNELWPEMQIVLVSGAHRPERQDYPERALFFTKPYAAGALVAACEGRIAA